MANKYPASGSVIVHVVDPAGVRDIGILTASEQEVAARFRFEKDAVHWRACRTALRMILGAALDSTPAELVLETGEFGKPALAAPHGGLHFNLSHCRNLALVALCGGTGRDRHRTGRPRKQPAGLRGELLPSRGDFGPSER